MPHANIHGSHIVYMRSPQKKKKTGLLLFWLSGGVERQPSVHILHMQEPGSLIFKSFSLREEPVSSHFVSLHICTIKDLASMLSSIKYLAPSECFVNFDLAGCHCHPKKQRPMHYALATICRDTIPL